MKIKLLVLCILLKHSATYRTEEDLYWDESEQDPSDDQYSPEFFPANDIYLLVGHSLQLNCSVPYSQIYQQHNCSVDIINAPTDQKRICSNNRTRAIFDISKLHILHCNTSSRDSCVTQNSILLHNRTIGIHRQNVTISDTGTYFCQYNNSDKTEANFYLKVGYKPHGPENITCVSVDLMNLNCSWIKSELDSSNPLPVRYSSYFYASPMYGRFDCPHPGPNSCSISSERTRGENYTFAMFGSYTLYINATNCCAGRITKYEIHNKDVARLSPPVITTTVAGNRNITLRMNLTTNTVYSLFVLKNIYYEVFYKSEYFANTINFTSSNVTNIAVMLSNLVPFTTYTIRTRIRGLSCKGECYWSTPITITLTTRKSAPDAVPYLLPSCYLRQQDKNIYIYVKPIRKRDKCSEDAMYQVKVEDTTNSKISRLFNVSWERTTINVTSLPRNFNYWITIRTVNDIGKSIKSQRMAIPTYNSGKEHPQNLIVEKSNNNYTIWWTTVSSTYVETITVYWCHGNRNNYICKEGFNWKTIPNNQTSMTVHDLVDKVGGDWMFSVAFQYTDGYNTGMIFSDCYFPSVTDAPKAVQPFNAIPISETELEITPLEYCSKQNPSMPLLYVVYYNTRNKTTCDKSFSNRTVQAQFGTQNITLQNLKPSTDYTICLCVVSKGGNITSQPVHARTSLPVLQEKSVSTYKIVLGVIGAVLFVIILFVCVTLSLKFRKKWKKPIEFILPEIREQDNEVQWKESSISEKVSNDSGVVSNGFSASNDTIQSNNYDQRLAPRSGHVTESLHSSTMVSNGEIPGRDLPSLGTEDRIHEHSTFKERSWSNLTESDSYANYTCTSSRTTSSNRSSFGSSQKTKSNSKRPSVKGLFGNQTSNENTSKTDNNLAPNNDSFKQERTKLWVTESIENLSTYNETRNSKSTELELHQLHGETVQEYVEVDVEGSVKSESMGKYSQENKRNDRQSFQQNNEEADNNSKHLNESDKNVNSSSVVPVEGDVIGTKYRDKIQIQNLQDIEQQCLAVDSKIIVNRLIDNKNIINSRSYNERKGDNLNNFEIKSSLNMTDLTINNIQDSMNTSINKTSESPKNLTSGISDYLKVDNSDSHPCSSGISEYLKVDNSDSHPCSSGISDYLKIDNSDSHPCSSGISDYLQVDESGSHLPFNDNSVNIVNPNPQSESDSDYTDDINSTGNSAPT